MPQRRHALAALRGSIPPLITPFKRGDVDYDRYAALVELQIKEGSHGILVNGTTAEPSTLTTDERKDLHQQLNQAGDEIREEKHDRQQP